MKKRQSKPTEHPEGTAWHRDNKNLMDEFQLTAPHWQLYNTKQLNVVVKKQLDTGVNCAQMRPVKNLLELLVKQDAVCPDKALLSQQDYDAFSNCPLCCTNICRVNNQLTYQVCRWCPFIVCSNIMRTLESLLPHPSPHTPPCTRPTAVWFPGGGGWGGRNLLSANTGLLSAAQGECCCENHVFLNFPAPSTPFWQKTLLNASG